MKNFIIIIIAAVFILSGNSFGNISGEDQCYTCHSMLEDQVSKLFSNDVHYLKGISCAGCHGGDYLADDMDAAMNPAKGFIGIPNGDKITNACVNCHSDVKKMKSFKSTLPTNQFDLLKESVHGKVSTAGNSRIVQCTTCHNTHGIKHVNDPASPVYSLNITKTCSKCHSNAVYIRSYNPSLPVDQYTKYKTSVHGILNAKGDPKPAECADCHGSHNIRAATDIKSNVYAVNLPGTCAKCHADAEYMKGYKIPTDQYLKYSKSVHGVALLEKNDPSAPACNDCHGNHAAAPPGVSSISQVCGTCHVLNSQLFSNSPHKKAFDELDLPECETCHGNHEISTATKKLLGVDENAVCSSCHNDKKSKGYQSAFLMKKLIDSLDRTKESAISLLDEAEQKGMEVTEEKFQLRDVNQAKQEARTIIHSFDMKKFKPVVDKGLAVTASIKNEADAAIHEYYFRRIGLGVSVAAISFLAFGLFLYIRKIEK